ncbi:uncharacterized protein LOC132304707 [Cornus florida]|uniref:uncharacterized protein LOC132304707 n=1 Tax=Cornus florida TaxID=4283 RepID=UPI0028967BC8|nr:uncharacterized protein LOC132304707 [Cornus florida]
MTTTVHILTYGCAVSHYEEYIKIGESTAIKCLKAFCNAIVAVHAEEYMRPPNEVDIAWLFEEGEHKRFQIKWAITQGPVRYWEKDGLRLIMKTCIILHNMIIEDEH